MSSLPDSPSESDDSAVTVATSVASAVSRDSNSAPSLAEGTPLLPTSVSTGSASEGDLRAGVTEKEKPARSLSPLSHIKDERRKKVRKSKGSSAPKKSLFNRGGIFGSKAIDAPTAGSSEPVAAASLEDLAHLDLKIDISRFESFEEQLLELVKAKNDLLDPEGVYLKDFKLIRVPRESSIVQEQTEVKDEYPKHLQSSLRYYNAVKYFKVEFNTTEEMSTNLFSRKKSIGLTVSASASDGEFNDDALMKKPSSKRLKITMTKPRSASNASALAVSPRDGRKKKSIGSLFGLTPRDHTAKRGHRKKTSEISNMTSDEDSSELASPRSIISESEEAVIADSAADSTAQSGEADSISSTTHEDNCDGDDAAVSPPSSPRSLSISESSENQKPIAPIPFTPLPRSKLGEADLLKILGQASYSAEPVDMKTRTLGNKSYANSFLGNELIDWIVDHHPDCENRSMAHAHCNAMLSYHLIVSTSKDVASIFCDDSSIYQTGSVVVAEEVASPSKASATSSPDSLKRSSSHKRSRTRTERDNRAERSRPASKPSRPSSRKHKTWGSKEMLKGDPDATKEKDWNESQTSGSDLASRRVSIGVRSLTGDLPLLGDEGDDEDSLTALDFLVKSTPTYSSESLLPHSLPSSPTPARSGLSKSVTGTKSEKEADRGTLVDANGIPVAPPRPATDIPVESTAPVAGKSIEEDEEEEEDHDDKEEEHIDPARVTNYSATQLDDDHLERVSQYSWLIPHIGLKGGKSDAAETAQLVHRDPRRRSILFEMGYLIYPGVTSMPVVIILALYDVKRKVKLSEDFSLMWNSHMMPASVCGETALRRGIFDYFEEKEDLFLVARVMSLSDPEASKAREKKKREDKKKKEKEKSKSSASEDNLDNVLASTASYTSLYAMAYGGVRLFRGKGLPVQMPLSPAPKSGNMEDVEICELLEEKQKKDKKAESSLSFSLKAARYPYNIAGTYTPFFAPIRPTNPGKLRVDPRTNTSQAVRVVESFEGHAGTYSHLFNHLYVYPRKLGNIRSKHGARVQVSVELRGDDTNISVSAIPAVYGFPLQEKLVKKSRTALVSDSKPEFFEEFKLSLPLVMSAKHHLFFTVYSISTKAGSKKKETFVLGYAILQLSDFGKVALKPNHELKLFSPEFLIASGADYLDVIRDFVPDPKEKHQKTLSIHTNVVSSAVCNDQHILNFFQRSAPASALPVPEKMASIQHLHEANPLKIVNFFPSLLNQLLRISCGKHVDIAKEAFVEFLRVAKIVSLHAPGGSVALRSYVTFLADPFNVTEGLQSISRESLNKSSPINVNVQNDSSADDGDSGSPDSDDSLPPKSAKGKAVPQTKNFHESCVEWMLVLLREKHPVVQSFRLHWFIMSLISRSLALHVVSNSLLLPHSNRMDRYKPLFAKNMRKFMQAIYVTLQNSVTDVSTVVSFWRELLSLMDRGVGLSVLHTLFAILDMTPDINKQTKKFLFLKSVSLYPNFVALNLPTPFSLDYKSDVTKSGFHNTLSKRLHDQHYITGVILEEVKRVYRSSDDVMDHVHRSTAISHLRIFLRMHELDPRFQTLGTQQQLSALYFPFLLILVDDPAVIAKGMQVGEKEQWLACFIYILRNTPTQTLRDWIQAETKKHLNGLLDLLLSSLTMFGEAKNSKAALRYQVNLVVIDVVSQLVSVLHDDLNKDSSAGRSNFHGVLSIYMHLLEEKLSNVVPYLIGPLQQLITLCPVALFPAEADILSESETATDFVEMLVYQFMLLCNSKRRTFRVLGSTLMFHLLHQNFLRFQTIMRTRTRATIGVSKIIGSQRINYSHLNLALDSLATFVSDREAGKFKEESKKEEDPEKETKADGEEEEETEEKKKEEKEETSSSGEEEVDETNFAPFVLGMVSNLKDLVQQNALISVNASDPEMLVALYQKISLGFKDSPKLRITWLGNLIDLHEKNGNSTEAAQCVMIMCALVVGYLKRQGQMFHLPSYFEKAFEQTCPNIQSAFEEAASLSREVLNVDSFTLNRLTDYLLEAIKYFNQATMYELCLEVYGVLSMVYQKERKYNKLIDTLDEQKALLKRLTDDTDPPDRLVPVYFYVRFCGKHWEEDVRGKSFIYKKPTRFNLPVMKKQMEEQFHAIYKKKVEVIHKSGDVDESKLKEDRLYLQLAGTTPYVSPEEAELRVTLHEQNFNIGKFLFESGYTDDGSKPTEDLATQRKKKTVYCTRVPFPYIENRIEIVGREEFILTPIENAIELIAKQSLKVQAELEAVPTRINPLQQTLQGSVVPMVNPGPTRICEIFFDEQRIADGVDKVEFVRRLMTVMETFLKKCGFAVRLNKYVMEEKHAKFSAMIEKSYSALEVTIKTALEKADLALASAATHSNVPSAGVEST